ncbi:MAG: hypothetical protein U0670_13120 [Anaerolineae bacterium]
MMKSSRIIVISLLLLVVLSMIAAAAHAISLISVTVLGTYSYSVADTCTDGNSYQNIRFSVTGTTDDISGYDDYAVVYFDGSGNVIDVDIQTVQVGDTIDDDTGPDPGIDALPDPVSRPFTIVVYDISPDFGTSGLDENTIDGYNWIVAHGVELSRTTFDPSFDPGCAQLPLASGACIAIPSSAVMGTLPNATQAYYAPGSAAQGVVLNPGTYYVLGVDASGGYYKIILACQYLWVPVGSMGPSYTAPWSGQPLPTSVVN